MREQGVVSYEKPLSTKRCCLRSLTWECQASRPRGASHCPLANDHIESDALFTMKRLFVRWKKPTSTVFAFGLPVGGSICTREDGARLTGGPHSTTGPTGVTSNRRMRKRRKAETSSVVHHVKYLCDTKRSRKTVDCRQLRICRK